MDVLHTSVMGNEVLRYLAPDNEQGELLIDATLGEGGHSALFLKHYPGLSVIGVDADGVILERARERLAPFGGRVKLKQAWFDEYLAEFSAAQRPTRVLFDLGISIFHYRASGRGFSFSV
ncbi:MAG: 16S rRNA (cytosine(1402)-N(4))-methyltransferase, partial [Spirochaeta sp.]|nr:16S rRNA (cytosine(1402)-N(4))-methyltransferase [Spirochaeta sp.]